MCGLCRRNPKSTILITASTTPQREFAWRIMPTDRASEPSDQTVCSVRVHSILTSLPPLAGCAGAAGDRGERRQGRHVASPALVGPEAEARLGALEGVGAVVPEEAPAAPGGAHVPVGLAVVVALTERQAVRHGGGGGRLGSADLQSPVPQYLTQSLSDRGLPHCRGLMSPQSHLPLPPSSPSSPAPASHLRSCRADCGLTEPSWK